MDGERQIGRCYVKWCICSEEHQCGSQDQRAACLSSELAAWLNDFWIRNWLTSILVDWLLLLSNGSIINWKHWITELFVDWLTALIVDWIWLVAFCHWLGKRLGIHEWLTLLLFDWLTAYVATLGSWLIELTEFCLIGLLECLADGYLYWMFSWVISLKTGVSGRLPWEW